MINFAVPSVAIAAVKFYYHAAGVPLSLDEQQVTVDAVGAIIYKFRPPIRNSRFVVAKYGGSHAALERRLLTCTKLGTYIVISL